MPRGAHSDDGDRQLPERFSQSPIWVAGRHEVPDNPCRVTGGFESGGNNSDTPGVDASGVGH
jgi:hypothetical protein